MKARIAAGTSIEALIAEQGLESSEFDELVAAANAPVAAGGRSVLLEEPAAAPVVPSAAAVVGAPVAATAARAVPAAAVTSTSGVQPDAVDSAAASPVRKAGPKRGSETPAAGEAKALKT